VGIVIDEVPASPPIVIDKESESVTIYSALT
jgi:hypothetical protein